MTPTSSIPFPEPFERVVNLLSRAYGTGDIASRLSVLNAAAAGLGNGVRIRTPDCVTYAPALNLGLVTSGEALIQGAQMALLLPITSQIQAAFEFTSLCGLAYTAANLASLQSQRGGLEGLILNGEKELRALGCTPVTTAADQAAALEEIMRTANSGVPGPIDRRRELAGELHAWRNELEAVNRSIFQARLEAGGHILLKDSAWREVAANGPRSFDGNWGCLVFSPHVLGELALLSRRDLLACAAAFQRTLSGSPGPGNARANILPGAWACLCGEPALWSRIMDRPLVSECGFLHDFIFCNTDEDGRECDPLAMAEFEMDKSWTEFLEGLFCQRIHCSPCTLTFSPTGASEYLALRRWSRQFAAGLSSGVRPYFAHWPDVAARIATVLAVMSKSITGETLPDASVAAACEFVKAYAPIQAGLIQQLEGRDSRAVEVERQMQRAVEKLRSKGPLSLRGLVRTYDRQDYGVIEELLQRAMERALVEQRGPLYFAAGVSGSAVSAPNVLNLPGAVQP